MRRVGKFEKVSYEQFRKDYIDCFNETNEEVIRQIYDDIKLPQRATSSSAGYDIFSPIDFELKPNEEIKIPTGIRARMDEDWVLCIFPRSSIILLVSLIVIIIILIMKVIYFFV